MSNHSLFRDDTQSVEQLPPAERLASIDAKRSREVQDSERHVSPGEYEGDGASDESVGLAREDLPV